MRCRRSSLVLILILLSLALSLAVARGARSAAAAEPPDPDPEGVFIVKLYYDTIEDLRLLSAYDLLETNNREEKYVLALVDRADLAGLTAMGFRAAVDAGQTATLTAPRAVDPHQVSGIPGFACYRTVEETYASAAAIADRHPDLAAWIDVGDSWEKSTGRMDGYDMMVLVLTNSAVPGPKPKLFITASIHGREYAPAELVTRFGEYLIDNYGVDADATALLDYHEIHLMLQANPDGRKEAEAGALWRKNTNQNYCGVASSSRGADLNRNFAFQWGQWNGSSGAQCAETYRGPSPASEPETQAIQNYMTAIFPDQRDDALTSAAPPEATGVYIDVHSAASLVLWPWGFNDTVAPNGPALQTLGRRMAFFNDYTPEQSIALYPTDGSTEDFAYGELGLASFTFELSGQFFQPCAEFTGVDLPKNLPALLYAAKAARTPYQIPAGPDALDLALSPASVAIGRPAVLSATVDDTRYRNAAGEPSQPIAAVEFTIDTPPWDAGAVAHAMAAIDGSLDEAAERVTATVNTAGLEPGRHILFVRGRDAGGAWGAFSAIFLEITPGDEGENFFLFVPYVRGF